MKHPHEIHTGDEVVCLSDESFDILTVIKVEGEYATCFEYNPKQTFALPLSDLEPV